MDIEYQNTPPKRNQFSKKALDYSTPNKKTTPKDSETPRKSRVRFQTPQKQYQYESPPSHKKELNHQMNQMIMQTPPKRGQNPQSRKLTKKLRQSSSPYTPCKSPAQMLSDQEPEQQISPFILTRLQTDYQFMRYLGEGNFSKVGLYKSRLTQQIFAIKITQVSLMSLNQIQALGSLSIFNQKSKHIIKYYHSWIEENNLYIVMEYCESNLARLYQQKFYEQDIKQKQISQNLLKEILKQSLEGLKCMHEHNMVHLDIKPDNLLINFDVNKAKQSSSKKVQKQINIKISDLGLCRVARIKKWSDLDQGDSRYLAKQILNYHQGINLTKADIFSLGMSIFQGIILQDLPNNGQEWLKIRQNGIGGYLQSYPSYSNEFKQIITKMASPNWFERPSCDQILASRYFNPEKQVQSKRLSRFMKNTGNNSRKKQSSL